jgi:uncharacterized membrane protein
MEARAKLFGHPIHQMLVPFPFGLLATAVVFEAIYLIWGNPTMATVSYWMIVAGAIGGLIAAPFGLVDWLAIPSGTRAKSIGAVHGLGNVVVLALFAASWWLRSDVPDRPEMLASVLAFAGGALALVTGWLGGELVDRLSVGVDDGAHLDAPSSLSGKPASGGTEGRRAA